MPTCAESSTVSMLVDDEKCYNRFRDISDCENLPVVIIYNDLSQKNQIDNIISAINQRNH